MVLSGICTCLPPANFPSPRWDFHMFCACLCLQGGGVAVWGGTVSFSSCTITGNTASGVRAHAQTSHRPDGKMADMPKSTLIFRFGLIFGSIRDMYVPAACKLPIAPMGFSHVLRLLVLAGRRCRCLGWHGELLIVHHHWQHGFRSACSRSNFPSPRWEDG